MSLTRALLIVTWCLSLATIHGAVAFVLGYLMPRNGAVPDHQRLFFVALALVSVLTAVAALASIVYVKGLWGVIMLSLVSGAGFLYGMVEYAIPFNLLVVGVLVAQFVLSRFAMGLNAIDNPGKPRFNPSEEF